MGLRFRQLALGKKAGQKRAPNNGSRCYGLPDVQSWRVDVDECSPTQLAIRPMGSPSQWGATYFWAPISYLSLHPLFRAHPLFVSFACCALNLSMLALSRTRELVLSATCRSLSRGMESGEAGGVASRMNINTSWMVYLCLVIRGVSVTTPHEVCLYWTILFSMNWVCGGMGVRFSWKSLMCNLFRRFVLALKFD